MYIPLAFIPPDNEPIWQAFQNYYQQNPIMLEESLLTNIRLPDKKFNYLNAQQAGEMLASQNKLKTIAMNEFGLGVVVTEEIAADACLLPIIGQYYYASRDFLNDDRAIYLQMYDDFFEKSKQLVLHQTGLFGFIQHGPNAAELQNYFNLSLEAAAENNIMTQNIYFDQTVMADFMYRDQRISLPFPLVRAASTLHPNTMLTYSYGDKFWQKRSHLNPDYYFRCFHRSTHQVINQYPVRRAFWFEVDGRPIKPFLLNEADIGKDISITIENKTYFLRGKGMQELLRQYPYATMLKIESVKLL